MKKRTKIIVSVISVVLIILAGVGLYAGNMLYNIALNPKTDKSVVIDAPHNSVEKEDNSTSESKVTNDIWLREVNYTDEYIRSFDNLRLHSYQIINTRKTNKWVILCHGYTSEGLNMQNTAKHFYENGFNILIPDARGHGNSEGDYIGMGWDDRIDLVDWCELISKENKNSKIVLYGISMGGATVMMASGETLPKNVKVIIEDCGYSSVWEEFSYQIKELFSLPEFPFMHFASVIGKVRAGYWIKDASSVNQLAKSTTPTLFIHGSEDTFVPPYMLEENYNAAANIQKEKLLVEGAGHGGSDSVLGDEYWKSVFKFINKYI